MISYAISWSRWECIKPWTVSRQNGKVLRPISLMIFAQFKLWLRFYLPVPVIQSLITIWQQFFACATTAQSLWHMQNFSSNHYGLRSKYAISKQKIFNYIKIFRPDIIAHLFSDFNFDVAKPLYKLRHGWIITSHSFVWMWLLIHALTEFPGAFQVWVGRDGST